MSWTDLLSALALVLIIEGMMPFLSPGSFKRTLAAILGMDEGTLRVVGLTAMIAGVGLLYLVR